MEVSSPTSGPIGPFTNVPQPGPYLKCPQDTRGISNLLPKAKSVHRGILSFRTLQVPPPLLKICPPESFKCAPGSYHALLWVFNTPRDDARVWHTTSRGQSVLTIMPDNHGQLCLRIMDHHGQLCLRIMDNYA